MGKKIKNRRTLALLKRVKKCVYCGKQLGIHSATIDHFNPRCRGGKRNKGNIKLACRRCNNAKGPMDGERWLAALPTLLEAGYMDMSRRERRAWRKKNPGVVDYRIQS